MRKVVKVKKRNQDRMVSFKTLRLKNSGSSREVILGEKRVRQWGR